MAKQTINVSTPNSGRGDPLRTAFSKINANFTELYSAIGADVQIPIQTGNAGKVLTTNGTTLSWTNASGGAADRLVNGDNEVVLGAGGNLTFPNNYTFTGQTLTDTSGTTNYSLKIANGTTGSVFAVGTGTDAYGVANDALDHTQTTYVPYNATASTMSFNIPGAVGSLVIGPTGVVTVPNGLVIPTGTKAANATGTTGQISYDANYMYICVATNTWKRSPLTGGY